MLYDDRVSAIHFREPATLQQFFHKEVWHGLGSFDGIVKGRFTVAELPSLATPVMTICGLSLIIAALLTGFSGWLIALGVALWATPPLVYTLRAKLRHGGRASTVQLAMLFIVYHGARAVSAFKWLGTLARR